MELSLLSGPSFQITRTKIDETVKIFEEAIHKRETTQCGAPAPRPNYVYGFGNLDCEKAYKAMEENRL